MSIYFENEIGDGWVRHCQDHATPAGKRWTVNSRGRSRGWMQRTQSLYTVYTHPYALRFSNPTIFEWPWRERNFSLPSVRHSFFHLLDYKSMFILIIIYITLQLSLSYRYRWNFESHLIQITDLEGYQPCSLLRVMMTRSCIHLVTLTRRLID